MDHSPCPQCDGSGRCSFIAHDRGPDSGCIECRGSMECQRCQGTGRLRS